VSGGPRIAPVGDAALVVELPASIDPETSSRIIAMAEAVRERCGGLLHDVVLGYCTLTVYFDPLAVDGGWLEGELSEAIRDAEAAGAVEGPVLDVPVCYGGELGPDLADVAAAAGLPEADVIALHAGAIYRVYMIGFTPGFAYMASVDPRIGLPRRPTPRTAVPAGSVAIAAGQTAVYPTETPGGWHLIGRTRVQPFDAARSQPFLFRPGDRVRFVPIDRAAFDAAKTP
jgi:KipI family sensor histidine kinase inhibitor